MTDTNGFSSQALSIDAQAEVSRIGARLRQMLSQDLHRRGFVLGLSGGVDSSVTAALCVQAVGKDRVFGLLLPEKESSGESTERGRLVAERLGIRYLQQDITSALEAVDCYGLRDEAIRRLFPEYGPGWKSKLVISGSAEGAFNHFAVVVRTPDGELKRARPKLDEYLQIVAATNYKQRTRKMVEYFHADRLHYAVAGTPNRLEYDQGFFVKNGDGSADVKPIAHLYKTQVYALARYLDLPEEVCSASPTTDTYSLEQGQDEFYFSLPYDRMDMALWAFNHGVSASTLAEAIGLEPQQAGRVYEDIASKRRTTAYLHRKPLLIDAVAECGER